MAYLDEDSIRVFMAVLCPSAKPHKKTGETVWLQGTVTAQMGAYVRVEGHKGKGRWHWEGRADACRPVVEEDGTNGQTELRRGDVASS